MTAAPESDRITTVVDTLPRPRRRDLVPSVTVLSGPSAGAVFSLERAALTIGRDGAAEIRLDGVGVSRRHARICNIEGQVILEDLGSTNGTWVNEICIDHPVRLAGGDRIRLGSDTELAVSWIDRVEHEASRTRFEMSLRDPLTGLYNRRALDERLLSEIAFADRHGTPLAVIVIDLDHFKQINDRFGHPCGDRVLVLVSAALVADVRLEDLVARCGGEELAVVARGIDVEGARVLAGRLRRKIRELDVVWQGERVPVSASLGLAHTSLGRYASAEAIVGAADAALYEAKRAGRNRVVVAGLR